MQQAISSWKDFDEGTEVDDSRNRSQIRLAYFGLSRQSANPVHCGVGGLSARRRDGYSAIVRYINLRARFLDQRTNNLAAWSNHVPNLVRIDLDLNNARSERGNVLTWGGERLLHCAKDIESTLLCLFQRLGHYLGVDTRDLNIHLQCSNASLCTSHLEVHVPIVVFSSGDVGKDCILVALHDKTHRDTRNRCFKRHSRIHH